jgi:hypothetical protein
MLLKRLSRRRALVVVMGERRAADVLWRHVEPALGRWPALHLLLASPHSLGLVQGCELQLPAAASAASPADQSASLLRWHPRRGGNRPPARA